MAVTINTNLSNIQLIKNKKYVYNPSDIDTKTKFWNLISYNRRNKISIILININEMS